MVCRCALKNGCKYVKKMIAAYPIRVSTCLVYDINLGSVFVILVFGDSRPFDFWFPFMFPE